MTPFKDWLEETREKIDAHKKSFSKTDARKFKLQFMERLAERVEQFSSTCGECYQDKGEITALLNNLEGQIHLYPMATKDYHDKIKAIVAHLREAHKLVAAGMFTAMGNAIGVAMGVSVGVALDNVGAGIGIGAGIGMAIGAAWVAKAKKEGKII